MKKVLFSLMALALCAMVFTSCGSDDDEDNATPIASITATGDISFSATALSKASSASESSDITGTNSKLSEIFKTNSDRISIYGFNSSKQFMSITVNATKGQTGSFSEGISATDLLLNYLQGGSVTDAIKNSVDALIIFKESADADESSAGFWFSTKATVNITNNLNLGSVTYMSGTFSATLTNSSLKAAKTITGTFTCPGI